MNKRIRRHRILLRVVCTAFVLKCCRDTPTSFSISVCPKVSTFESLKGFFVKNKPAELLHAIVGLNQNRAKQKLYEGIQRPLVVF